MFEGSFLRRHYPLYGNACAVVRWKLNITDAGLNLSARLGHMLVYLDDSCSSEDVRLSKISLPVSVLGLLLSLFSASIFIGQRQRTSFRTSLVALSVATSGYMLFTSLDFINVLTGACFYWDDPRRHAQVLVAAVVCLMSDSLLCLRNWCNLLMTAQRTEALLFPLRVRKLLNRRNFVACLLLLYLLFLPMSLVRSFAEFFVVCSDPDGASYGIVGFPISDDESSGPQFDDLKSHYSYLIMQEWFHNYESHVFFIAQTLIPVTLVMAFSLAMSVTMVRNRGGSASVSNSQSKRNKARASRTVLCLAIIFSALQMPSYLGHLLSGNETFTRLSGEKTWQLIAELCLFLDSIFNMFVYAYFVPDFKAFFVRQWRRVTCQPVETRRLPLGSSDYSRRVLDSAAEARALRVREAERRAEASTRQSQRQ